MISLSSKPQPKIPRELESGKTRRRECIKREREHTEGGEDHIKS
jgi:hypothetical protein